MNEQNFLGKFKAGVFLMVLVGFVCGIVLVANFYVTQSQPKSWHVISEFTPWGVLGEADLGEEAGGILEIYFVNHSATYVGENTSATIEGWCDANNLGYTEIDDFEVELAHSVAFDVVVRVRGNVSQCYRTDQFFDTDLRVRWTSSDLSVGADTEMTGVVTHNESTEGFLFMNFESKGGGSGFTLTKDQSADIDSIKFEAYY